MNFQWLLIQVLSISLLSACGSGKEKSEEKFETEPPPGGDLSDPNDPAAGPVGGREEEPDDDGNDPGEAPDGFGLTGLWRSSACVLSDETELYAQYIFQFIESSQAWGVSFNYFSDNRCRTILFSEIHSGSFKATLPDPESGLLEVDMDVESVRLVPRDDRVTEVYNDSSYYGYSDWQTSQPREILGRSHSGGQPVQSASIYATMLVDNGRLYHSRLGTSSDSRPTSLLETPLLRK